MKHNFGKFFENSVIINKVKAHEICPFCANLQHPETCQYKIKGIGLQKGKEWKWSCPETVLHKKYIKPLIFEKSTFRFPI